MHWFFAHLSTVLELGTYFAVVPVHISHKVCIIRWSYPPYATIVTQLCLHWCSAQLSDVLTFSPNWSQGLCVEADEAVFGELASASCFHINWWCLMSILTCACIGVMHIWALYRNWAHMLLRFQCTSVTWSWAAQRIPSSADDVFWAESLVTSHHTQQVSPTCACIDVQHICFLHFVSVHIGYKACVSSQMKQWLVSLDLHLISPSTNDVWWAYSVVLALVLCTSERCTETEHICCCGSSAHQSQGLYPQLKLWLMIRDAQHIHHQLMMFYDHVVSVSSHNMQQVSAHQAHSCACVDVLHIWALYLNWAHIMFIVHSHKIFVYLFTWSSTWWAGICSILHHHSCWNGLSSLCFWASKTYTLWQNDRYGCFKMKRHYGNSSLNLSINCEEWQVNNHSRIKMHYVIHHWHSRFKAKEWQVSRQYWYWLPMHHVISHRQKWQIGSHACMTHSCLLTTTKAWTPNSARTIKMMLSFIMSTALWMKGSYILAVRWLSSECNKSTRSFSQNDLDLGQAATLCSLVTGKDGKDHQQQKVTVKLFSLGKDHPWTSITSSQHPRDYLWVASMCTNASQLRPSTDCMTA